MMTIENKKFKLLGVGIDTTTIRQKPVDDTKYSFIYTSISANNDYIIADYVKSMPDSSLAVGIDFLDSVNEALNNHLKIIGKSEIDLLLIDSKCDFNNFNYERLKSIGVKDIGIKNPESINKIEEFTKITGEKIRFISIDLSPLCFNYDIVKYCEENEISIVSFNPLGGYISSPYMIESFTVPYLLSFSSTYSSIVFLSGRDLFYSGESKKFLDSLVGKDTKPIFNLRKSVNKLINPKKKKIVNTSIKFDDSILINYDSPELLYDYEDILFSFGKLKEDEIKIDSTVSNAAEEGNIDDNSDNSVEGGIRNLFKIVYTPSDITNNDDLFAIYRYHVFNYLKVNYPKLLGWEMEYIRLADKMIGIKLRKAVVKGWWKKREEVEEIYYFFAMINGNNPIFLKFKNSDRKA